MKLIKEAVELRKNEFNWNELVHRVKEIVQEEFEAGHTYSLEDPKDLAEEFENLSETTIDKLFDKYHEFLEMGPKGFYEEFKDELNFDPDFIAEYGKLEEEWEGNSQEEIISEPIEEVDVVTDSDTPITITQAPAQNVEVKVTSTTTAEIVNPEFEECRKEIARDTIIAFEKGEIDLATLNKRVAAIFGSVDAAFKFLTEEQLQPEEEPVVELEVEEEEEVVEESLDTSSAAHSSIEFFAKDIYEYFKNKYDVEILDGYKVHIKGVEKNLANEINKVKSIVANDLRAHAEELADGTYVYMLEKAEKVAKDLKENIEKQSQFFKVTYKVPNSSSTYSSLLVRANSEEEAREIFIDRKPKYVDLIVGISKISEGEANSLLKRGISLFEDVEGNEEEDLANTPNPPTAGIDVYIANTLGDLIVGEWDTIKDYNNFMNELIINKSGADILNIIKDIVAEEHEHIGQLQQALKTVSPNAINLAAGEEEGSKQIAAPVDVGNPTVDGDRPTKKELSRDTF